MGLKPEDMNLLLSNASIYEQIKSAGKGGYGERVMEKLEDFADQAGKLDELTDKIHTSLMQMSFDSLRDSFLNSLMDMDKDAKGFSEDFAGYMQRALLNFAIGDLLNKELEGWYNGIARDIQTQKGKLREEQIDQYRSVWEGYVQQGISIRDGIAEITGYGNAGESSGQQGTNEDFKQCLKTLVVNLMVVSLLCKYRMRRLRIPCSLLWEVYQFCVPLLPMATLSYRTCGIWR